MGENYIWKHNEPRTFWRPLHSLDIYVGLCLFKDDSRNHKAYLTKVSICLSTRQTKSANWVFQTSTQLTYKTQLPSLSLSHLSSVANFQTATLHRYVTAYYPCNFKLFGNFLEPKIPWGSLVVSSIYFSCNAIDPSSQSCKPMIDPLSFRPNFGSALGRTRQPLFHQLT